MILFREIVEARLTVLGDPELMEKQLRVSNGETCALAAAVDTFLGTLSSRETGTTSWEVQLEEDMRWDEVLDAEESEDEDDDVVVEDIEELEDKMEDLQV